MLKRKGVSDEKKEDSGSLMNKSDSRACDGSDAWFTFHCVMGLEAISSTYPQLIDLLFCLLNKTMARKAKSEEELCRIVTPSVASFIVKNHFYSFYLDASANS